MFSPYWGRKMNFDYFGGGQIESQEYKPKNHGGALDNYPNASAFKSVKKGCKHSSVSCLECQFEYCIAHETAYGVDKTEDRNYVSKQVEG